MYFFVSAEELSKMSASCFKFCIRELTTQHFLRIWWLRKDFVQTVSFVQISLVFITNDYLLDQCSLLNLLYGLFHFSYSQSPNYEKKVQAFESSIANRLRSTEYIEIFFLIFIVFDFQMCAKKLQKLDLLK